MPDGSICSAPATEPGEKPGSDSVSLLGDRRGYLLAKRSLDVGLCLLTLPITLPLMGLIGVLVRLDSRGPALFVQERIGMAGRSIRMYKFRTLPHNIDRSAHEESLRSYVSGRVTGSGTNRGVHKPFDLSRVTPVGRVLRRTSLDELPQVINVLKGEMSLVGPRPNLAWEVDEYQTWHHRRLEVLPGMTGLAQVNGRSSLSFDRIVEYDIEYIEQRGFWLDLKILLFTLPALLSGRGAR